MGPGPNSKQQFGGSLLAVNFRDQTTHWAEIVNAHVRAIIVTVHTFIKDVLEAVVLDQRIREELWEAALVTKLSEAYKAALDESDFLLRIERDMRPSTCSASYKEDARKAQAARERAGQGNSEYLTEYLHDILQGYYKVSLQRFVDIICRQVVEHRLLHGKNSPLKVLTPKFVTAMDDDKLNMIAGEDALTRRERERLTAEIAGLEEATEKIFRG